MDVDGLTFVTATRTEARAARRAGIEAAVVGIGAPRPLPEGRLVSFGLAGGLHDDLSLGDVIVATRVVDEEGVTLWEGDPLPASRAKRATVLAARAVLDDPAERRALHRRTGADVADLETGPIARSGRFAGCLRAVSDTPSAPLGPLADVVGADGSLAWRGVLRALGRPRQTARALGGVRVALRSLAGATA